MELFTILKIFLTYLCLMIIIKLYKRNKPFKFTKPVLMIIFGSGGHTGEML